MVLLDTNINLQRVSILDTWSNYGFLLCSKISHLSISIQYLANVSWHFFYTNNMTYQLSYSESIDTADGASCCSIISVEICQLWMGGQLRSLIPPHLPWLTLSSVIGAKWVSSRNPSSTLTPASISRGLPNVSLRRWSLSVRELCWSCAKSPPLQTSGVFQTAGSQMSGRWLIKVLFQGKLSGWVLGTPNYK